MMQRGWGIPGFAETDYCHASCIYKNSTPGNDLTDHELHISGIRAGLNFKGFKQLVGSQTACLYDDPSKRSKLNMETVDILRILRMRAVVVVQAQANRTQSMQGDYPSVQSFPDHYENLKL